MFKLNLKIALRNLWKNKGFSLINIGGLAIGLACCLMLMLYVNYEWSYDRELKKADHIYLAALNLKINNEIVTTMATPNKLANAIAQELPGVQNASRITFPNGGTLFAHEQNHFKFKTINVDPSFLAIMDYDFIYGNPSTALNDPNSAVMTQSTAEKLFGKVNPVGQHIRWDNQKDIKVAGVIKDLPKNQTTQFEILQPWAFLEQIDPSIKESSWGNITCRTIIELKENAVFDNTNAALKKIIVAKDAELKSYMYAPFLFPITKSHLYTEFEKGKPVGGKVDQVNLFFFLGLCVLVIACINYMNLSTARSEKRAKEVGVRKALGSARKTIMGQFVIESLLLSFIAMLFAFVILEIALPYFNHILDIDIRIDYASYLFWATLMGLVLITGFLAGSYPAFYLSSFIPVKVLKGFKGSKGSLNIRRGLVILQFSLSVCMIISAIIIHNQINFLNAKPLGFEQNNMVQMDLEGELKNPSKLEIFKNELKRAGAIVSATEFSDPFTSSGSVTGNVKWPGKRPDDQTLIDYKSIGFDFVNTVGTQLVAGRDFSAKFTADTSHSILLNEAAVKKMNLKNPIGTIIHWTDDRPLKVVGVIRDFLNETAGKKTRPNLYYYDIKYSRVLLLRLNPNQSLSTATQSIKEISQRFNPAYPIELQFISQKMAQKLETETVLSLLSNLFGIFAILISCLGLLGLALYMAEQRSKEISIRKVLGAGLSDILVLLNKDFMRLVVISNLIAIPVAYILANKWLQKYDYKIDMNLWPFVLAVLASVCIAVLTVSLQTFKVAKANAIDALKYE